MNLGFESETVEHKKTTAEVKAGVVSLASMLNKHGECALYFGVRNDGEVVGQQIGEATMRDVSQAIAVGLKPPIIPTITTEYLDGKSVVKVVARGSERPYSAYGKYYMRAADEDKELAPNQLRELMAQIENADALVRERARVQDLDFGQLRTAYAARGLTLSDDTFERNLGLRNDKGEYNLMAELLADRNDTSIKAVTFRGKDKSDVLRRNEYGGKCLVVAMDQVTSYIEALNDTKVAIGAHQREERTLFDMDSFTEAWQNACLHNRWTSLVPPAVYVFSDRIEIVSTGGLPQGLSEAEFYRGVSHPVNSKLQKIFGQLGFAEQTGHGIPTIVSSYGRQAFEIMDNHIIVTIPFDRMMAEERAQKTRPSRLGDAQRKVYEALSASPDSTVEQLSRACGISNSYTRKVMSQLKDMGLLRRVGSNKAGHWEVL